MQAQQKSSGKWSKNGIQSNSQEGAHFIYQRREAELCGQKRVTLLRTAKVYSSAWLISSPANLLYALGISDREVKKDKNTSFTRKLLAHQETAAQYYTVGILIWNLNRLISEQVKNCNFFLLRQTAERSKLEDSFQFWSSEYCAQVIWKVTPESYQK